MPKTFWFSTYCGFINSGRFFQVEVIFTWLGINNLYFLSISIIEILFLFIFSICSYLSIDITATCQTMLSDCWQFYCSSQKIIYFVCLVMPLICVNFAYFDLVLYKHMYVFTVKNILLVRYIIYLCLLYCIITLFSYCTCCGLSNE